MEADLTNEEAFALLDATRETRQGAPLRNAGQNHTTAAIVVRQYIAAQELCYEFSIPKNHGESVALLFLIDMFSDTAPRLTVTEAGLLLNIPGATTARKLRGLSEIGLVTIAQDPTDKRRFHPSLTATGTSFLSRYATIVAGSNVELRLSQRFHDFCQRLEG